MAYGVLWKERPDNIHGHQFYSHVCKMLMTSIFCLMTASNSNKSVVNMRNQRNGKKGLFFEAKRDLRESRLGVKMCLFLRKRVLLDSTKGSLGVVFQIPANMFPQKRLFRRGKFGGKITRKFSYRGCFSWRGQIAIRVCFENLWSSMCTTLVFESLPRCYLKIIKTFLKNNHGGKNCGSWEVPSQKMFMFGGQLWNSVGNFGFCR